MGHKIGDVVQCTDSNGTGGRLTTGNVYTITDMDREGFVSVNHSPLQWSDSRFEIVKQPEPMTAIVATESCVQEASRVAGKDRSRDYGHPLINHQRIADIWNVILGKRLKDGEKIQPREVALCMVGTKLAREVNTPKRDNVVDAHGYLICVDMIDQELARLDAIDQEENARNEAAYNSRPKTETATLTD